MKILITGICGFVGSTLARGLKALGHDVFGVDNLSRKGSRNNFVDLNHEGINATWAECSACIVIGKPDWIIHCASNPSVTETGGDIVSNNLGSTMVMLELAKQWKCGFTLISTSRVYSIWRLQATRSLLGKSFNQTINERFSTEAPISLYGATKRCSEILALEYAEAFDIPVFINRCGVLAGAGQFGKADQGIFSYWIHSWAQKKPLKYIGWGGTGAQVRDCLHPKDMVPLLHMQMQNPEHPTKLVNVAGGIENSCSLKQLSEWCEKRFGPHEAGSEPENRKYDVPCLVLDCSLAKQAWGWQPQTKLHDIFEEIAQHAENNPNWLEMTQ